MSKGLRFNFTVSERILLHLMDYMKFVDQYEVPEQVAQKGIGEAIGIVWNNVPRAMKKLKKEGFVLERLSHVKGDARKKKVYFLTPSGFQAAKRLRESLENSKVLYRDESGEIREVRLGDIPELIGDRPSILDMAKHIDKNDVFDATKPLASTVTKNKMLIDFSTKSPKLKHFYGRTEEIEHIGDLLANHPIVCVHGIAGIGKSTLALKLLNKHREDRHVFWYRFHEWDTLRNVVTPVADFLMAGNRKALKNYLDSNQNLNLNDLAENLEGCLKDLEALFVFDDFHKANSEINHFFSLIAEIMERVDGVKILIMSRRMPSFYDRREVAVKEIVMEFPLRGLDKESSLDLLKSKNLAEKEFEAIYNLTEGHPLALELISQVGDSSRQDDVMKFVYEEVFSKLAPEEKQLLSIASVYRFPVPSKAFFTDDEVSYEALDNLLDRSLIQEVFFEKYDVHDLIREFFYKRLTPAQKIKYHLAAARFYSVEGDELSFIEAIYHYLKAGDPLAGARIAVENGDSIVDSKFIDEFQKILNEFTRTTLPASMWGEIQTLKGDILMRTGKITKVLKFYEEALSCMQEDGNPNSIGKLYEKIGLFYLERSEWDNALKYFNQNMDIMVRQRNFPGIATAYINFATVHYRKGEFEKSIEFYKKNLELCKRTKDAHGMARAYNNLGILHWEMNEPDRALEDYKMSLKLTDEPIDREVATVYFNMGEIYRNKAAWDDAIKAYLKCLDAPKELLSVQEIAAIYNNLGDAYNAKGESTKAQECYAKSSEYFASF